MSALSDSREAPLPPFKNKIPWESAARNGFLLRCVHTAIISISDGAREHFCTFEKLPSYNYLNERGKHSHDNNMNCENVFWLVYVTPGVDR